MFIIAHRANIGGPNPSIENTIEQILLCISRGYDCEIDIWNIDGNLYLGHDYPQYKTEIDFLLCHKDKLWIHCKNGKALEYLVNFDLNIFFHSTDDYILTSKKYIWCYPGQPELKNSIVVMPELHPNIKFDISLIGGVCTDYPEKYVSL